MKDKKALPKDKTVYDFIKDKRTLIASLSEHSYVRVIDGCGKFIIIAKPMDLERIIHFNITDCNLKTVSLIGNSGDIEIALEYIK